MASYENQRQSIPKGFPLTVLSGNVVSNAMKLARAHKDTYRSNLWTVALSDPLHLLGMD